MTITIISKKIIAFRTTILIIGVRFAEYFPALSNKILRKQLQVIRFPTMITL